MAAVFAWPVVRFVRHAVEMCVAMCVAAIALNVIFFEGAWLLGYEDLRSTAPVLSSLFLTLSLSVPMVAWMRFRGHAWQPTIEMAASTVGLAFVLFIAAGASLIETTEIFGLMTRLACPAMIGVMLVRFDLYAGQMSHHHHAAA